MGFQPQRRKDDKYPRRVLGFFQRFFIVIGVAATISIVLLALTVSRMMSYTPQSLPDKILLSFTFDGDLAEVTRKPSLSQPLLRPASTLHEVTAALRSAAEDDRVKGFIARIEGLSLSTAQIQELRDAIHVFRKSGKFTHVYADSYGGFGSGMGDYYLAAAFENVWMQPVGAVAPMGISLQVPFLKNALEKAGITAQFAHRGRYKSASESLTETTMSAPHREMMTSLLSDLSGQLVADIAADRGLDAAAFRRMVDAAPFSSREALEKKLVDRLGYSDEMIDEAKAKVAGEETKPVDLLGYTFVSETKKINKGIGGFVAKFLRKDAPPSALKDKAKIALIFGAGDIVPYSGKRGSGFSEGGMSADKIVLAIRAAQKDEDVAAIVFRIDSPGGAPTAAESIRRAIIQARAKGKPVVVSMGGAAASGGYWVAAGADKIVAQPATLTGSIGVFGGKFVLGGLMDKLGIGIETLSEGENADMWSGTTPFTPAQAKKFDAMLGDIYDAFLDRVMEGRKMTRDEAEAVAQGRVFTGKQAKDNGLVDALGGLDTAVEEAKKLAQLEGDVPLVRFPPRKSTLELFLSLATEGAFGVPDFRISAEDMIRALKAGAAPDGQVLKAPFLNIE